MLPAFLATTATDASASTSWIAIGALGLLLTLGLNFFALVRIANGKANERQIEPTQLSAIQAELKAQTSTLHKLDREMGGVAISVENFRREISEVKTAHITAIEGVHSRIGGISRELASTVARVDGIERREGQS